MAAKPITRAAHAKIREAGGEMFILTEVSSGHTLKDIAESLGISRPILSAWCNAPARRDAYTRARREAAGSLVEQGLSIVDAVTDPSEVPAAKLQSDFRKWMAARLSSEEWGEQRGPMVEINLGAHHLDALRSRVINPDEGD
jgi:hypothetical protein